MNNLYSGLKNKISSSIFFALVFLLLSTSANAQMRQVYLDNTQADNEINKLSFYSANEGYAGFVYWVGYTQDSGRTFTKKFITNGNVNYNGYSVNLTFGFGISGVKAFSQNNLLVYGDYGFVPSILRSIDGGNTFTLVFHSQYNPLQLRTGITDMVFPQNTSIGYAIDADRVLKTTNQGLSWNVINNDPASYFDNLAAIDDNTIFAYNNNYQSNKFIKTSNGGTSWQNITLPVTTQNNINAVTFLNSTTGWLSLTYDNIKAGIYKTTNGGNNWVLQNDVDITPFACNKIKFIDVNVGFATTGLFEVYKTFNGGAIWEPLPRDNNYEYLGYSHNDLQVLSSTQLWAGGGHGFLELNTNASGNTLPKSYFKIDTIGVANTSIVNLVNYSRTGYTYKWFVNNSQISTNFNASYIHNVNRLVDTLKLVVNNGVNTDTLEQYQYFTVPIPPLPIINSFTPVFGQLGSTITITGNNFLGTSVVKFGGTPATTFNVISNTTITATLGMGASGYVYLRTPYGQDSLAGFTSLTPRITSFTPTSGGTNSQITITGVNFTTIGSTLNIKFGNTLAQNISILSDNAMIATVGAGSSGFVKIQTSYGVDSLAGFTYIPPPKIINFTPTAANQGSTVTINGTNLIGTTDVKFGGVSASNFTIVSPNVITATVGFGSSGFVKIINPRGNDSLSGFIYTSPVITSFTPVIGGSGSIIEIVGQNFTGTTSVSFGGVPVTTFTVNSPTSISATVASGASGNVVLQTPNGTITKSGFTYSTVPIIHSFSPKSGAIGSLVQIMGANFNNTIAGNTVYFGCVKGVVTSATPNLLTVTVPASASYQPITVTSNNLTAITPFGFLVTFAGGGALTSTSFGTKVDFATKGIPNALSQGDIDGDGKPDLIVKQNDTISIFKNSSTVGNIILNTRQDIFVPNANRGTNDVQIADVDGDGKLDIICADSLGFSILKNTSTVTAISFASPSHFDANNVNSIGNICDINNDGKLDIVFNSNAAASWIINTSTGSTISFSSQANTPSSGPESSMGLTINDYDGDGKQDIAVSNNYVRYINTSALSIFKNVSTSSSSVSFANPDKLGVSGIYPSIASGDLDGDNNPDLIYDVAAFYTFTTPSQPDFLTLQDLFGVRLNKSDSGKIKFNTEQFVGNNSTWGQICLGSLDGDSKVDVTSSYYLTRDKQQIFQNYTNGTSVNFGRITLIDDVKFGRMNIVDLDGDGKADITTNNLIEPFISIFKNKIGDTIRLCQGTDTLLTSNLTGTSYQWQQNTGSGFVNITNNANFNGTNTLMLRILNVPLSFNNSQFRCVVNTGISNIFTVTVTTTGLIPIVTISTASNTVCTNSFVAFTATPINGGTAPAYQWQVNGVNVGTNSNTFTTSTLTNNAQVKVILTSSLPCALPTTATSNVITMTVTPFPIANAGNDTTICNGSSAYLNGRGGNAYVWSPTTGLNNPLIANPIATPTVTTVYTLTVSNGSCTSTDNVMVSVIAPVLPTITISTSNNNVCNGIPVTFNATTTNGGNNPIIQWQVNGVNVGNNTSTFTTNVLNNNDVVKAILTSNFGCVSNNTAVSNSITLQVQQLQTPILSLLDKVFTVTNFNATATYTWQILNSGIWADIIPLTTGISFTAINNGTYRVKAVKGGCTLYSTGQVSVLRNPSNDPFGIYFYPNPTKGIITMDSIRLSQKWETLEIVNPMGTMVLPFFDVKNKATITINVSKLSSGVYFAILRKKDKTYYVLNFLKM